MGTTGTAASTTGTAASTLTALRARQTNEPLGWPRSRPAPPLLRGETSCAQPLSAAAVCLGDNECLNDEIFGFVMRRLN